MIRTTRVASALLATLMAGSSSLSCSADDGAAGKNGQNGANGTNGADGKNGANGSDGKTGANGGGAEPTKPAALFTSVPAKASTDRTATFVFGCTAGDCTYEHSLDGAPYVAATSPTTLTSLAAGTHT